MSSLNHSVLSHNGAIKIKQLSHSISMMAAVRLFPANFMGAKVESGEECHQETAPDVPLLVLIL